jgi:uncharacterized protein
MIRQDILEEIVKDQQESFQKKEEGALRDIDFKKYLKTPQITVISGIRRGGKSTLLKQFSTRYKNYYYLNFDDERLVNFEVGDFQTLMITFGKLFSSKTIFLDEIQNVPFWERFVRRIYEEGFKIFVTGSNANLLGSDLATHLTGRYFLLELYPFSFREFLKFRRIGASDGTSRQRAIIMRNFEKFVHDGGFPEFVKYEDKEYLKKIYQDILYKDILIRFGIRDVKAFRGLAGHLFANFTRETSYNSLKNFLSFKNVMSVKNHIEHMQESYLIFELFKYDYSFKKQYVSNKKIYIIDNGMRSAVSFQFSEDWGQHLENAVFLELKRRGEEIYYFKNKKECDFILQKGMKIFVAVQVAYSLDNPQTKKREIEGLLEAMEKFRLKKGMILTNSEEGEEIIEKKKIIVKPVWKWLLEK